MGEEIHPFIIFLYFNWRFIVSVKVSRSVVTLICTQIGLLNHVSKDEDRANRIDRDYRNLYSVIKKFGELTFTKTIQNVTHSIYEITDRNNQVVMFYIAEDSTSEKCVVGELFSLTLLNPFI